MCQKFVLPLQLNVQDSCPSCQYTTKRKSRSCRNIKKKFAKNLSSSPNQEYVLDHYSEESSVTPDEGSKSTTGDRNIVEESGLSEELVNSMCRANISQSSLFRKKFDGKQFDIPLDSSKVKSLPIVETKSESRFGGNWTSIMRSCLLRANHYCVWVLKKQSRKGKLAEKTPRQFLYRKSSMPET